MITIHIILKESYLKIYSLFFAIFSVLRYNLNQSIHLLGKAEKEWEFLKIKFAGKRLCSFLLTAALLCSTLTAGAVGEGSLRTETVLARSYRTSAMQQVDAPRYEASRLALTANVNSAKQALAAALLKGESAVDISAYAISQDDFLNLVNFVIFTEYPEISDIRSYEYQTDRSGVVHGVRFSYFYTQAQIQARSAMVSQAADAVLAAAVTSEMTDLQKVLAIHDYLVLNCEYDQKSVESGSVPSDSFTAYGVFVNRIAVCQGYSAAFQMLMNRLGIACVAVQSNAMNHAWNLVRVNDQWYHVDATWDDPVPDRPGEVRHNAFMQSDAGISDARNRHYSWDAAGYTTVDTQFDKFDWSSFSTAKPPVRSALALDTRSYAGRAGSVYQFLAKGVPAGTEVKAVSSDPSVASVTLTNAGDPRGSLYTVQLLAPGTATILVTDAHGGLRTMTATADAASLAA